MKSGMLALALGTIVPMAVGDKCDLKTIRDGYWCDTCSKILEKEDLIGGRYCKVCNEGKERKERTPAKKVKVCVKVFYVCPEHEGSKAFKAGRCQECKKDLEKRTDYAKVNYTCEGCGAEGKRPGACKNKACRKEKKKIVAVCSKSGTFPHVPEK